MSGGQIRPFYPPQSTLLVRWDTSTASLDICMLSPVAAPDLRVAFDDDYAACKYPLELLTRAARSGIRLPHTYAYHWCAPSRAAFFTGRYVPMHGYEDGGDGPGEGTDGQGSGTASAVPLRFRLLPQVLQTAGCE